MRESEFIPVDAQLHYWLVARQCIREFHADVAKSALEKATKLRRMIEQCQVGELELSFNAEPIEVACNATQSSQRIEDHLERYLEICDQENP